MQSKNFIGSIIIVATVTALVASSMRSNTLRAISVSELRAADNTAQSYAGQTLRVVGTVGTEKVRRVPTNTPGGVVNVSYFVVHDEAGSLQVEYRDALPDTFHAGGQVQVDGHYTAPGQMVADHVFTKCPSKYEGADAHPGKAGTTPGTTAGAVAGQQQS